MATAKRPAKQAAHASRKTGPSLKKTPPPAPPARGRKAQASATGKTASTPVETPAPGKTKKIKVVRDSFTIPKNEFAQIAEMKKKAMGLGIDIKKSELIRAGLLLLTAMSDAAFKKALANVPTLKTGRPGKS